MTEQYVTHDTTSTPNGIPCANQVQDKHTHGADEHNPPVRPETVLAHDEWLYVVQAQTAKAKATLDASCWSRIDKAEALVMASAVSILDAQTARVQSQSTPGTSYTVNGKCTCKDITAPAELCKHRLARFLYVRAVQALTPVETTTATAPQAVSDHVAPYMADAAITAQVYVKFPGEHTVKFVLRDHDDARLTQRVQALLARY